MFADRVSAGRALAPLLMHLRASRPVVLGLPRGGVPVAAAVADALDAPLDLILVRKIGAPGQPELAIGAIAEGPEPLIELDENTIRLLDIPSSYINAERTRQWVELQRRQALYRPSRAPIALSGRAAVIVDDGIATGATMRVAVAAARRRGAASVVVAVPVAAREAVAELEGIADQVIALETPAPFFGVGVHYDDFTQVQDEEVRDRLAARRSPRCAKGKKK